MFKTFFDTRPRLKRVAIGIMLLTLIPLAISLLTLIQADMGEPLDEIGVEYKLLSVTDSYSMAGLVVGKEIWIEVDGEETRVVTGRNVIIQTKDTNPKECTFKQLSSDTIQLGAPVTGYDACQ